MATLLQGLHATRPFGGMNGHQAFPVWLVGTGACCPGLPRSWGIPPGVPGEVATVAAQARPCRQSQRVGRSPTDSRESECSRPSRVSRPCGELATSRFPLTSDIVQLRPLPIAGYSHAEVDADGTVGGWGWV